MFKRQSLGVKEGTAIESIVIYEWKMWHGQIIEDHEREAWEAAWDVVERRTPFTERVAQKLYAPTVPKREVPSFEHEVSDTPPVNYMCPTPTHDVDPLVKLAKWASIGMLIWLALASIFSVFS